MEHGITPVKNIFAILLCRLCAAGDVDGAADEQRIVIVASAESGIKAISAQEVRRAYLGATIVLDGVELKPLLNQTDKLAGEVFLQKYCSCPPKLMNGNSSRARFRGGSSPKAYQNLAALLAALQSGQCNHHFHAVWNSYDHSRNQDHRQSMNALIRVKRFFSSYTGRMLLGMLTIHTIWCRWFLSVCCSSAHDYPIPIRQ